jgi:RNA polymerase sigma factor (TIGR02999 family)
VEQFYETLRALAARCLRGERGAHTLDPTALVHEAYLRLVANVGDATPWRDEGHFLAAASNAIRRALVDHARHHLRQRRGGGQRRITLTTALSLEDRPRQLDLLDLDEALTALQERDPRKARLVELRFFAGLTVAEAASKLGISDRVAVDDWAMARAWIARRLSSREE